MYTYDVTIGRNDATTGNPMATLFWRTFKQDVIAAIEARAKDIESAGWSYQLDAWEGLTSYCGVPEESFHTQLRTDIAIDDNGIALLREDLRQQAIKQHQDCIALAIGQSELIYQAELIHQI